MSEDSMNRDLPDEGFQLSLGDIFNPDNSLDNTPLNESPFDNGFDGFSKMDFESFIIPTNMKVAEKTLPKKDKGIDIQESATKKNRLIDEKTVSELSAKLNLTEKDTNNLKKLNQSDAVNVDFFLKLRSIMTKTDVKSKLMDNFDIRKSYTGFHDWYKGERIDLPSVGIDSLAKNMGYSIMIVPVKNDALHPKYQNAVNELQHQFLEDISNKIDDLEKLDTKSKPEEKIPALPPLVQYLSNELEKDRKIVEGIAKLEIIETPEEENERFIDNEGDIIERTVVLDNQVTNNLDSAPDWTQSFNTTTMESDNTIGLSEMNIIDIMQNEAIDRAKTLLTLNTSISDSINESEDELNFDYDDSINHDEYGPQETVRITKSILDK